MDKYTFEHLKGLRFIAARELAQKEFKIDTTNMTFLDVVNAIFDKQGTPPITSMLDSENKPKTEAPVAPQKKFKITPKKEAPVDTKTELPNEFSALTELKDNIQALSDAVEARHKQFMEEVEFVKSELAALVEAVALLRKDQVTSTQELKASIAQVVELVKQSGVAAPVATPARRGRPPKAVPPSPAPVVQEEGDEEKEEDMPDLEELQITDEQLEEAPRDQVVKWANKINHYSPGAIAFSEKTSGPALRRMLSAYLKEHAEAVPEDTEEAQDSPTPKVGAYAYLDVGEGPIKCKIVEVDNDSQTANLELPDEQGVAEGVDWADFQQAS